MLYEFLKPFPGSKITASQERLKRVYLGLACSLEIIILSTGKSNDIIV